MLRFKQDKDLKAPNRIDITKLKNPLKKAMTAKNLKGRMQNIESSTVVGKEWMVTRITLLGT